jgi:hypothetical protein
MRFLYRSEIHGHVSPGFEIVREAFSENFTRRNELGVTCWHSSDHDLPRRWPFPG